MKTSDPLYIHFSDNDKPLSLVKRIIDDNHKFYSKLRVRVVLVKTLDPSGEVWRNGICVFQTFLKNKEPKSVENQMYEKFKFLETWLELDQIESCLEQLKTGKIVVGEQEIITTGCSGIRHFEFRTDGHSKNPIYYFQGDCNDRPNFASHEPIISFSLPVYPSAHSAIRNWCGVQNIDASSHLFGSVLLFLQECRAWVSDLEYLEDGISVNVQSLDPEINELRLKGVWEEEKNFSQFSQVVISDKVKIEAPEKATGFNFYLVDNKENLYDFHQEISNWSAGQSNILPFLGKKDDELEDEKIIREALASGEGLQIEYKPFIKKDDKWKLEELVETTVAFLNASGGRILIGVNNYCAVDGLEKNIFSDKKTLEKELEEYCGFIKQLIGSATEKLIEFSVTSHKYDGHWIVMANISEGKEKPYQSREKLMFFVRKGSSNKRATTNEIKEMIRQSGGNPNLSGLSGSIAAFE